MIRWCHCVTLLAQPEIDSDCAFADCAAGRGWTVVVSACKYACMVFNVHRNQKAILQKGIRKKEIVYIYISLHCHHQNDCCIKTGSDASHFNYKIY